MKYLLILLFAAVSCTTNYPPPQIVIVKDTVYRDTCYSTQLAAMTTPVYKAQKVRKQRKAKPIQVVQSLSDAEDYRSSYSSGQCQGMTKKGRQCSRTVKSGSYCWQHGG